MAAGGVLACARAAVSWPTRSARSAARWASARAARSSRLRRRTRPARMQKISHPATNPPEHQAGGDPLKRKQDARFDDQQIDADRSQSEREQRGADATEPHAQRDDEREWRQRKLRGAGAGKKDSGPRRDRDPGRRDSVRRHATQEPAESRGLVHRSLAGHVGENGLARQITTTAMMMLTREPRNMAQELCCPSPQPLSTAQSCQPNAVFACSAGDATHDFVTILAGCPWYAACGCRRHGRHVRRLRPNDSRLLSRVRTLRSSQRRATPAADRRDLLAAGSGTQYRHEGLRFHA